MINLFQVTVLLKCNLCASKYVVVYFSSNGKIFTLILGKDDFLLIWNEIVSQVNNNFMSKKQYLYIEITKMYIHTIYNGSCLEHLLYTVVYILHSFCKRMYTAYCILPQTTVAYESFLYFAVFGAEKNHEKLRSPYWENFKY